MKRLLMLIYPLIVTWETAYWVPVQCPEKQQPDTYAGNCIAEQKFIHQAKFTEKTDFDKWMEGIKKEDPRFKVKNVQVFEYDDKRTKPTGAK